ncbi:MAG TPA: CHAP domain-containing protein [Candidatus Saccharimonadales bacterium]
MKLVILSKIFTLVTSIAISSVVFSSPIMAAEVKESNANVTACFGQLRSTSNNPEDRKTLKGSNAEQNRLDKEACREQTPTPEPSINGGYLEYLATAPYATIVDPWGYYNRTATSYAAFKVYQSTGYAPHYYGNAAQWPASAQAAGKTIRTTPSVNSVGVIVAGAYGHLVWVERVNSDSTIDISQYDYYNAGGTGSGHYSEMRISSSMPNYYISF